jgi:hypothetical protein
MGIIQKVKQAFVHQAHSTQYLAEIAAGSDNQQQLLNEKLSEALVRTISMIAAAVACPSGEPGARRRGL